MDDDDETFPQDLIIEWGDCQMLGRCACGKLLGVIRPNQSLDVLGTLHEIHTMREGCP